MTRIGLLYPGEMGTAVARLLRRDGHHMVTTLAGRGEMTCRNCRAAGLQELETLEDVVNTASVLLVLVPPAAALQVAEQVRQHLPQRPDGERLVYVDLNSVAPETARAGAAAFAGTNADFVDGAILGLASRLGKQSVLYLSGEVAAQVAALFEKHVQVQVLGNVPGQASLMRMLLSGLTKGIIALVTEMALAARQADILDRLLAAYQGCYPGVMEVVERILPTYPLHARRRGQEMAEVESTLFHLGLCPTVMPGIRQLIVGMGECGLTSTQRNDWSVTQVIEELHARHLLRPGADAAKPQKMASTTSRCPNGKDAAHGGKTTLG